MAGTQTPDDHEKVASHTLAFLRSHARKLDLILEEAKRQGERLGRLEGDVGEVKRDIGEVRRHISEVKRDVGEVRGDVALLENKVLSSQTEIMNILYRLDQSAGASIDDIEPPPEPTGSRG